MFPEHLVEDLRHRTGAEDTLAESLGQARKLRPQPHMAKPERRTMVALHQFMQLSMDAVSHRPEMQDGRAVQQAGKIECRVVDQQIDVEHERLADGFSTGKGQDLEGVGQTCYDQTKFRFVDGIEHRRFSTGGAAGDSRRETWPSREAKYNLGNDLREKKTKWLG
ncbi:hypothetical protein D3C85_1106840 [compost metagenome]